MGMLFETDVKQLDDREKYKRQAHEYIDRILYGADYFRRLCPQLTPTVFISNDVLHTIAAGTYHALYCHDGKTKTICGYEIKIAAGENVLYIGYNLM